MKYFSITNLNQVYYIEVLKACFIIGLLRNREEFRSGDKFVSLLEPQRPEGEMRGGIFKLIPKRSEANKNHNKNKNTLRGISM